MVQHGKKSWLHIIVALITWVFMIQCVVWIALSLGSTIHTAIFEHRSVQTSGTVTALVQKQIDDVGITLCPQFRFSTADGTRYLHTSSSCSSPSSFEVGQAVPVRYAQGDPDSARIDTFWQTWALPAAFGIAAVVTGGVGWFGLMYARKRKWTINLLS
jgi:hypothetical protein